MRTGRVECDMGVYEKFMTYGGYEKDLHFNRYYGNLLIHAAIKRISSNVDTPPPLLSPNIGHLFLTVMLRPG